MICQNLPCRSPHRTGYYFAGPALEGTSCGADKLCIGGECLDETEIDIQTEDPSVPGGWSEWTNDECSSGCLLKSKGFQKRQRTCTNPLPVNSGSDCEGLSFDVSLCDDKRICGNNRYLTTGNYATMKCREFSELIPDVDGAGIQAKHELERLWVSCSIFCRRKDISVYYSPRLDLNDLGKTHDSYFPDGTHCHNDGTQDYYCLHHHCLPEDFQFGAKATQDHGLFLGDDIPFWLGNALPEDGNGHVGLNEMLREYMSLDGKRKTPLRTQLSGGIGKLRSRPKDWDFGEDDVIRRRHKLNELYFQ